MLDGCGPWSYLQHQAASRQAQVSNVRLRSQNSLLELRSERGAHSQALLMSQDDQDKIHAANGAPGYNHARNQSGTNLPTQQRLGTLVSSLAVSFWTLKDCIFSLAWLRHSLDVCWECTAVKHDVGSCTISQLCCVIPGSAAGLQQSSIDSSDLIECTVLSTRHCNFVRSTAEGMAWQKSLIESCQLKARKELDRGLID